MRSFFLSLKVGFFLATREIRNSNKWTTGLIIFIMALSFLNLVVARGLLVGLTVGASDANKVFESGDIFISNLDEDESIPNSPYIIEFLENLPQVEALSPRYLQAATIEANYKTRTSEEDVADTVNVVLSGVNPEKIRGFNNLSQYLLEGDFIESGDVDQIVLERSLLREYNPDDEGLENVEVGTKVRLSVNGNVREVTIKGILIVKSQAIQQRVFMDENQVEQLLGRTDFSRNEIAVNLKQGVNEDDFKSLLIANGINEDAKIQTSVEAQPKFLKDITATFAILGDGVGGIALVVAAITIFIIIFVNAITRRKFIGIMKGVGIDSTAIISSYVMQAIFYATIGTSISLIFIYSFLIPYFARNPIDFPFSDGILVADVQSTVVRASLLMIATILAGYVPARMIVNRNTLDSILGR